MPSLHGNWYAAASSATTVGTSASCITRSVTSGGASALRATAIGVHLHRELEVGPGLALLARRAQQVRRVVGHDERPALCAERVQAPAQLADRRVGVQQVLRGDAPHRENDLGIDERDLALQV